MIAFGVLTLAVVVMVLAGRDTDSPPLRPSSGPVTTHRAEAMPSVVAQSEEICRAFSSPAGRRQMADELGAASTSDEDLATAYGQDFQPRWRTQATRYCLQGLSRRS